VVIPLLSVTHGQCDARPTGAGHNNKGKVKVKVKVHILDIAPLKLCWRPPHYVPAPCDLDF